MKKINRLSQQEFDLLTEEQKRVFVIQVQQEDTMYWQKLAAQIQVFSVVFGIIIVLGWVATMYMNSQ